MSNIYNHQYHFHIVHSCEHALLEHALLEAQYNLLEAIHKKQIPFYMVDHDSLLNKLEYCGMHPIGFGLS